MAEISAQLVKELREKTGAGMMDCKKALQETNGDMTAAIEWLRKKGIASADKKGGRVAAEGLVGSYIHTGGRIGVLVEVNCETDFVARGEKFKDLVSNIAMQVAACPNVEYVKVADIPSEVAQKEKDIEMGRDDLANKPDNIKEKIVQGRIEKRLKELSLLDQPYIRDQNISVEELVKQSIAELGENIQVRRFSRFVLGEGIEKKQTDFAQEVAAQTGQKTATAEEEPAPAPEPEAKAAPEPEPEAKAAPEAAPEPEPEAKAAPEPEAKPTTAEKEKKTKGGKKKK